MLSGEKFSIFHKYIEDLLGRPIWTHELAIEAVWNEIKEKSKPDFLKLCTDETEKRMNNRTEEKLKDVSGMIKAVNELLHQAWERGYKYGLQKGYESGVRDKGEEK